MSFTEHLEELRSRLIRVLIILVVGFFVCYSYGDKIADFLLIPLREAVGDSGKIVYQGVLDKVLAQFQLAFWSAVILTAPLWFYQIWKFIEPGLYEKESKVIRPFIFVGFVFFVLGVLFGYYVVFPVTFTTLLDFGVQDISPYLSFRDYIILASKVLVFLGIVFQLPNVMLILGFMDLVTKYSLREVRPYVYVGFSVISAILTPPDIITMGGLWLPLVALYELGILAVAAIVHPYLKRKYEDSSVPEKS